MKNAIVTGANRGIGLEIVRQLKQKNFYVIGCCRKPSEAQALNQLADEVITLDVTEDKSIHQLVKLIGNKPIDLLVNNAGTSGEQGVGIDNINRHNFLNVLNVNCVSVVKLSDALLPNIEASQDKNILVISSQMGSIDDNDSGGSYAYRASKAALNCAMRSFAIDVKPRGVHVMLIHPGWVKTDMGGKNALIDVDISVKGIMNQAERHISSSHAENLYRFDGGTINW